MATITRSGGRKPLAEGTLDLSARSGPGTERPLISFSLKVREYDEARERYVWTGLDLDRDEAQRVAESLRAWLAEPISCLVCGAVEGFEHIPGCSQTDRAAWGRPAEVYDRRAKTLAQEAAARAASPLPSPSPCYCGAIVGEAHRPGCRLEGISGDQSAPAGREG